MSFFPTLYQKHPRLILLYKNDPTTNSSRHSCFYENDKVQYEYGAIPKLFVKIFQHPLDLHYEVKILHRYLLGSGDRQFSPNHKERCKLPQHHGAVYWLKDPKVHKRLSIRPYQNERGNKIYQQLDKYLLSQGYVQNVSRYIPSIQ